MKVIVLILALVCVAAAQMPPSVPDCATMMEQSRKYMTSIPAEFLQQTVAALVKTGVPEADATNFYKNIMFNKDVSVAEACVHYNKFLRLAGVHAFKESACPSIVSSIASVRKLEGLGMSAETIANMVEKQVKIIFQHTNDDGILSQAMGLLLNKVLDPQNVCSRLADLYRDAFTDKVADSLADIDFSTIKRWIKLVEAKKAAQEDEEADAEFFSKIGSFFKKYVTPENIQKGMSIYNTIKGRDEEESDLSYGTLPYYPRCVCVRAPCPCDRIPKFSQVELFDDEEETDFDLRRAAGDALGVVANGWNRATQGAQSMVPHIPTLLQWAAQLNGMRKDEFDE